jgi:hypothetical protein
MRRGKRNGLISTLFWALVVLLGVALIGLGLLVLTLWVLPFMETAPYLQGNPHKYLRWAHLVLCGAAALGAVLPGARVAITGVRNLTA